jgi:hypothetical protein
MLDVVGCILEVWLAVKGFAVSPSSSAPGMLRDMREQRLTRCQVASEQRESKQAAELQRVLQKADSSRKFQWHSRGTSLQFYILFLMGA